MGKWAMIDYSKYKRVLCWFSCGAASATATKLALKEFEGVLPVEIHYQDTGSEHPDNKRFLADCEKWFGQKIIISKNPKFKDHWEVMEKGRYIAGVAGAPCTSQLKRKVAEGIIDYFNDLEVFGYTVEEEHRVKRFIEGNEERRIYPILIDKGLAKEDCLALVAEAGIELPTMYKLGYKNNNCIGCPKGGKGYWNLIRRTHPEAFERMSKLERTLDAAVLKDTVDGNRIKVFLDELDPSAGEYLQEPDISCGIMCQIAKDDM